MSVLKGQGFILKSVSYGEADLILAVLTQEHGVLSFFVRGARKSKKRFGGGVLNPPHLVEFETGRVNPAQIQSQDKLISLKEVRLLNAFDGVRSSYKRLQTFSNLVQVVLSGEAASEELFHQFGSALRVLSVLTNHKDFFTHFVVRYLYLEGVLPFHQALNQMIKTPILKHKKIKLDHESSHQSQSLARYFFQDYAASYKERIKWPH